MEVAAAEIIVGAPTTPGWVRGVEDAGALAAPVPAALVAATRNRYAVPLVSPVTVPVVEFEAPSSNGVQVPEDAGRYSIR